VFSIASAIIVSSKIYLNIIEVNKKILLINQSPGYLSIDIANAFSSDGFEVVLWSGSKNISLPDNIHVSNGPGYNKKNIITRFISWVLFSFWMVFKLRNVNSNQNILAVSNPPFAPLIIPKRFKNVGLLIYDLYPDILIGCEFLRKTNFIYKFWVFLNKISFKKSSHIFTIGEQMAEKIKLYSSITPISVIPNWYDENLKYPLKNEIVTLDNIFQKNGNELIILYAGNIGITHPIEFIIEIAKKTKSLPIKWVFIGEGGKKKNLLDEIKINNLSNVVSLPYQPLENFGLILKSADIGLILLDSHISGMSIPSKTYNLLKYGKPLLAICDSNNEIAALINKYNNGRYFSTEQENEFGQFLNNLANNREQLKQFEINSFTASKYFTSENAKLYPLIWKNEILEI
jgi:hypothetical protein